MAHHEKHGGLSLVLATMLGGALLLSCGQSANETGGGPGHDGGGVSDAGGGGPDANVKGTLPCAVDSVFVRRCQTCHSDPPKYGAPMPLVTLQDLHAFAVTTDPLSPIAVAAGTPVYKVVEERIHSKVRPMPQAPNPPLDPADMQTLDDWIASGAPAGDACMSDAGQSAEGGISLDCKPDTVLKPTSPWAMPTTEDDVYVCYGVDVTPSQPRQIIGMAPNIDNHTIVHHVLLYQADTAVSSTPAPCNPEDNWHIVYGWAPGGTSFQLPPTVGFDEDNPTHYVVQVHYNNINHVANQKDATGFSLCTTTDLRPNHADVMAFGSTSFTIPAHGTLDITCSVTVPSFLGQIHTFAAFPHMHELGKTIETHQYPGGSGSPIDMGTVMTWNFQDQVWGGIEATLNPGDVVKTRCAWDNSTNAPVSYGPYTEDEMCYSFTMYYPKITYKQWVWAVPAYTSTCSPTP